MPKEAELFIEKTIRLNGNRIKVEAPNPKVDREKVRKDLEALCKRILRGSR